MKRILGILALLAVICVVTACMSDRFLISGNIENLIRRTSLFGILSIGAAFVIIGSGIDLSIGSMVCLVGVLLPWLVTRQNWAVGFALAFVLGLSGLLGMAHGWLVTRLKLQPFIVTLCGLLMYRGLARTITGDRTQGFGIAHESFRKIATGRIPVPFLESFSLPASCLIFVALALLAALLLNRTTYGRYLQALGRNEQAARFSGINTARVTTYAYIICALLAGVGGVLFVLDVNSAQPSDFGNFYELYAIAAAVLGGCSIRGGDGTILGVVIGTALMQVLRNSITLLDIPTQMEFAIIGAVILAGVILDELARAVWRRRGAIEG